MNNVSKYVKTGETSDYSMFVSPLHQRDITEGAEHQTPKLQAKRSHFIGQYTTYPIAKKAAHAKSRHNQARHTQTIALFSTQKNG